MVQKRNRFSLVMLAILGLSNAAIASVETSKTSHDDLYSESIYLKKSSAETPTSLESNAKRETNADADLDAPVKKVSARLPSKKSTSN